MSGKGIPALQCREDVKFLHGRLHFHLADGTRAAANSGAPSALIAYGEEAVRRLEQSGLEGTIIGLRSFAGTAHIYR